MNKKIVNLALCALMSSLGFLNAMEDSVESKSEKTYLRTTADSLGLKMDPQTFENALQFEKAFKEAFEQYDKNARVFEGNSAKNIVVTIGNTGAGKSTLLNLLSDKELTASGAGYVLKNLTDNDSKKLDNDDTFTIGTGQTSETLLPKFVYDSSKGFAFVDLPGFSDSRGDSIALFNAVLIRTVLTSAKSVKFLFVEGEDTVTAERGAGLKKTLKVLRNLLREKSSDLSGSSLLVVSKTMHETPEDLVTFFKGKLEKDIYSVLDKLFFLDNKENPRIVPFENCAKFFKNKSRDRGSSEKILKEEELNEALNYTKKQILSNFSTLKALRVEDIDTSCLLKVDMDLKVNQLFEVIKAKHFLPLTEIEQNLDKLSDGELSDKRGEIRALGKTLGNSLLQKGEVKFLQRFGKDFCDVDQAVKDFERRVSRLNIEIEKEIKARADAQEKLKRDEEIRVRREFTEGSQYSSMLRDISDKYEDMYKKKNAWSDYNNSFSGWDIFTLGLSKLWKDGQKVKLESEYYKSKSSVREALNRFRDHPMIQRPHPRDNEIG